MLAAAILLLPAMAHAELGDELTVYVLTFGPGSHPFYKFGHNAVWIHDETSQADEVYNFGTFRFNSPTLIPEFFMGRFRYWLSRKGLRSTLRSYKEDNRSVESQKLNLTAAQKLEIHERLKVNLRIENRYYKYDYYRDNCSTRVRDLLDSVLEGRLQQATNGPGAMTYRQHTLRLVADYLPEYVILDAVMGPLIDRPTTFWDEMFLPHRLQEGLRKVTVPTPSGEQPLVASEEVLVTADRPPMLQSPPAWTARFGLLGVALGGGFALLGRAATTRRAARITLGALLSLLGLLLGFFGCFYIFAWAVTDHAVGYRNANILQFAPWAILLTGYGIGVACGRPRSTRVAFVLSSLAATASILGLLLYGLLSQDNVRFIALLLPFWIGTTLGLFWLSKARRLQASARPAKGRSAKEPPAKEPPDNQPPGIDPPDEQPPAKEPGIEPPAKEPPAKEPGIEPPVKEPSAGAIEPGDQPQEK